MATDAPYRVEVNQSFHLSGEAERYELGKFASCQEARSACMEVVDEFLGSRKRAAGSARELLRLYRDEGPEPFIVTPAGEAGGPCSFSATEYAEERCRMLFAEEGSATTEPPDEPPVL